MSDDGTGVPTPKTSQSFMVFHHLCEALAARLHRAAFAKRKQVVRLDLEGAKRAEAMASDLTAMADKFAKWPEHPERAAEERVVLVPWLGRLQREAEEMLGKMGGGF